MPTINRSISKRNSGRSHFARVSRHCWVCRRVCGLLVPVLAAMLATDLPASESLRTYDGKHDISHIRVTVVYFVPRDRTPLPDWEDRVAYFCRKIERFHERELQGQSSLKTITHPRPFISDKDCAALRNGDRDFIFFLTLREVEAALPESMDKDDAYPILLVLSDINWRELEDFHRIRIAEGQPQFEGQIIGNRHFPGAASGGARSLYWPNRGVGWGLVSADGWRVPYSGSDAVVYHEGVGHPIGLPHPEPGNGSVMSLAQYRFWLNQSWIDEAQKKKLGWKPANDGDGKKDGLFSTFTAIPDPLVPTPGQEVSLRMAWPAEARVKQLNVRLQTALFGPWYEVPTEAAGPAPERVSLGTFDRPTPVSYRVDAVLEGGQEVELWGYFQIRRAPEVMPLPPSSTTIRPHPRAANPVRWDETVDLLSLVNPRRDRVSGDWEMHDGRLESSKQYGARIEIPYQPPREYVMTVIAEPLDDPNGLIIGQRSGDRRFLTLFNFVREGQPPASALENIDGLNVERNATTVRAKLLEKNRPSAIVCTVRENSVTVTCDGRSLIDWRGDASRLSLSDYWQTPNRNTLFLGAYDCRYRFHRVSLAPISGEGEPQSSCQ